MIRFVDEKTGNIFNGSKPYIFWFDGAQSINIIYNKIIYLVSNEKEISISIPENPIFHLINVSELNNAKEEQINEIVYKNYNELKTNTVVSSGTFYLYNYVHAFYIGAEAFQPGEYTEKIYITECSEDGHKIYETEEFLIGADFYEENESLYINLSNNGIEIPSSIQKALYTTNVLEDNKDNIVLNRKWKELLSNFWDIIANKGSYKSLYNSLKWFEYGNNISLHEVWNRKERFGSMKELRDIQEIMSDSYSNTLYNVTKTTYLALSVALKQLAKDNDKVLYDGELNPVVEDIAHKWSKIDLSLKVSLLGNFYQTYFMPIHLDLIQSTIEDVIFTNTFKNIVASTMDRKDQILFTRDITCNILDGSVYKLQNVNGYVIEDTIFGYDKEDPNSLTMDNDFLLGVEPGPVNKKMTNKDLQIYASKLYAGAGSIINVKLHADLWGNDKIKKEYIKLYKDRNYYKSCTSLYESEDGNIEFNLLIKETGEYQAIIQLETLLGEIFVKKFTFNVINQNDCAVNFFRIKRIKGELPGFPSDLVNELNDYVFNLQADITTYNKFQQFIPAVLTNNENDDGVALNHLLILKKDFFEISNSSFTDEERSLYIILRDTISANYFQRIKGDYIICISKTFNYILPDELMNNLLSNYSNYLYRKDHIFCPEYHILENIDNAEGDKSYLISQYDAICVIPDISFGKYINDFEWEFINVSKINRPSIKPGNRKSIKNPFIAKNENRLLDPGYYNVIFRYTLDNDNNINEIITDSAFRIV